MGPWGGQQEGGSRYARLRPGAAWGEGGEAGDGAAHASGGGGFPYDGFQDPGDVGSMGQRLLLVEEVHKRPGVLKLVWMGTSAVLFVLAVTFIIYTQNHPFGPFRPTKDSPHEGRVVFASLLQILFFMWVVPINLHIFYSVNINILPLIARKRDFEEALSRHPPHPSEPAFLATVSSTIMVAGLVAYLYVFRHPTGDEPLIHEAPIAPVVLQFAIWSLTLLSLIVPLFFYKRQRNLFQAILECAVTIVGYPVLNHTVSFFHTLIADGITSSTLLIFQIEYSLCHFAQSDWGDREVRGSDGMLTPDPCGPGTWHYQLVKPLLYLLPYWIRFVQSVFQYFEHEHYVGWRRRRHLWNALKYLSAMAVVVTSSLTANTRSNDLGSLRLDWTTSLWIGTLLVKTAYCFLWDIYVDWGLGHREHGFLRKHRVFKHDLVYYLAALTNFGMRITWSFAISPHFCTASCSLLLGVIEISRRAQWNVFRMEKAYIDRMLETERQSAALLPPEDVVHVN